MILLFFRWKQTFHKIVLRPLHLRFFAITFQRSRERLPNFIDLPNMAWDKALS